MYSSQSLLNKYNSTLQIIASEIQEQYNVIQYNMLILEEEEYFEMMYQKYRKYDDSSGVWHWEH